MFTKTNEDYGNWYSHNYDSNGDLEYFIKYISEKISSYEENINSSYINIKNIINKLEEEFPQIDVNSFSEFFLICEEYYNLLQISKKCLEKLNECNRENEKLNLKASNMKEKQIGLKSLNQTLYEESKFKEDMIKKLEEDLHTITRDYMELSNKLSKNINNENESIVNSEMINNHISELKTLTEEKTSLQRENLMLSKNVERLENEIRNKYIFKNNFDKMISKLEVEKTGFQSKIRISEINLEKTKREVQNLKVDNDELKKELERSEKKVFELANSTNRIRTSEVYYSLENRGTPLNFMLCEEEDEEIEGGRKLNTLNKLKRESTKDFVTDFVIEAKTEENSEKKSTKSRISPPPKKIKPIQELDEGEQSDTHKEKELNLNDELENLNSSSENEKWKSKTCDLKLTSHDIVDRMSNNDFHGIKILSTEKHPPFEEKKSINIESINININKPVDISRPSKIITIKKNPENYDEKHYKEFFMLTYQSLKLNSDNIEPFLYV